MTTVIVDRKEGKVYSDSRCTQTNISGMFNKKEEYTFGKANKIYRVHGHVITGCGSLGLLIKVVNKFHTIKALPKSFFMRSEFDHDNTTVLVNKRTLGKVYTARYELFVKNYPFGWKRVSVAKDFLGEEYSHSVRGSGMDLALGAMEQGATPKEAITIAAKYDIYTDSDVKVVDI